MNRSRRFAALTLAAVALSVAVTAIAAPQKKQKASSPAVKDTSSVAVATVNGEKITRGEIADRLMSDQLAQLNATNPQAMVAARSRPVAASIGALIMKKMSANPNVPVTVTRKEVIDWLFKDNQPIVAGTVELLIRERVVAAAAKNRNIALTPQETSERYREALDQAKKQSGQIGAADKPFLAAIGYQESSVRRALLTQLLLEKIIAVDAARKIGHSYGPADYLDASHILVGVQVMDPNNKEQTEKAFAEGLKKIQGIAEDIKNNKITFEAAAQQYNTDQTKFQKGSLGIFIRGQMVPEFEKAAFDLPVGKVSEPVRSLFGWHLIKVNRLGKDLTGPERADVMKRYIGQNTTPKLMALQGEMKITNTIKPPAGAQQTIMPGR